MLDSSNRNTATIDLSQRTPDFFSCCGCLAFEKGDMKLPEHHTANRYGWADRCTIMQERGQCAKMMLARALEIGAVQVVLHVGQPDPVLALERGR